MAAVWEVEIIYWLIGENLLTTVIGIIDQKDDGKMRRLLMSRANLFCTIFALALALSGCSNEDHQSAKKTPAAIKTLPKPNIVVILTDQERFHTHWPEGWAEKHLHAINRLKQHGLSFNHAYTAACECTPSRAVLTTSEYFPINKVPQTPPSGQGLPSYEELADIGSMLKSYTDYEVVWKGKWHLTPPLQGGHDWTAADIPMIRKRYEVSQWNPPDAGTAITEYVKNPDGSTFDALVTLGGGYANNDGRFLAGQDKNDPRQTPGFGESILEYIQKIADTPQDQRKPFCLFVSFVNPHDVWVYPVAYERAGYKKEDFVDLGIELPSNYRDTLETKPSVQLKARNAYQKISPLTSEQEDKEYVNFYAYLQTLVDGHVGKVLDALEEAGLMENTVIIRTADHGEGGLSHGMREKAYTVYEEMIHIPLVISNPKLFPHPQSTEAFYCHLDLMPTIADIVGVPADKRQGKGVSIVPVINNPEASVQTGVLFAYDDIFFLPEDVPGGHIRAIREGDWTYAVYYSKDGSHFEYEMYNLRRDPGQLNNLLYQNVAPEHATEARRLHQALTEKIQHAEALPKEFPWPSEPFYTQIQEV